MSGRRHAGLRAATRLPALVGAGVLHLYRATISPLYGDRCKYHPTCSQYALDAVREVGLLRGTVLAGWRLLRCNPWSHGGIDRVADRTLFRSAGRTPAPRATTKGGAA